MATTITTSTQAGGAPGVRGGQHALAPVSGGYMLLVFGDSGGGTNVNAFVGTNESDFADAGTAHTGAVTMGRTALLEGGWGLFSTGAFAHASWGGGTTWTAGTGTAIAGFAAYSGFKDGSGNWHAIAAPAGAGAHICDIYAATSLGGAWTQISNTLDLGTALSNSGNDCIIALPNNGAVLVVAVTAAVGTNLVYALTEPLTQTTASGTTWGAAATIGGTHIATQSNNLSGVTDGAGRSWIALNDGTGIIVYALPAGAAWSSPLHVSSASTDASPCLCLDGAGNPWAFYIDNNGAIFGQKLAYSAGPTTSGALQTIVANNGVARQRLVAANGDANYIYLSWVETTTSPYPVVLHVSKTLSVGDSGTGTDSPLLGYTPAIVDLGQAVETLGLGATQTVVDAGTAVEGAGLGVTVTIGDGAAATESVTVTIPLLETGHGADTVTLGTTLTVADAGTATEAVSTGAALSDSGTGTDAVGLGASIPVSDAGAGLDLVGLLAGLTVGDLGTGVDIWARTGARSVGDAGVQMVVALRPVNPSGRLYTTFVVNAGDQPSAIPLLLLDKDTGFAPVDLTGSTVDARLYRVPSFGADHNTPPVFTGRACTLGADPTTGAVDFPCRAGDFAASGSYELDLAVTQGGARVTSVQSLRVTVQAES